MVRTMTMETSYKIVIDDRKPVMIKHSLICHPPADPYLVDNVDTSYPGIVIKYDNGYLLEDGVHRMAKLQKQGVYESLFYVVTIEEYKRGLVHMMFMGKFIPLGEWNAQSLSPSGH